MSIKLNVPERFLVASVLMSQSFRLKTVQEAYEQKSTLEDLFLNEEEKETIGYFVQDLPDGTQVPSWNAKSGAELVKEVPFGKELGATYTCLLPVMKRKYGRFKPTRRC